MNTTKSSYFPISDPKTFAQSHAAVWFLWPLYFRELNLPINQSQCMPFEWNFHPFGYLEVFLSAAFEINEFKNTFSKGW